MVFDFPILVYKSAVAEGKERLEAESKAERRQKSRAFIHLLQQRVNKWTQVLRESQDGAAEKVQPV